MMPFVIHSDNHKYKMIHANDNFLFDTPVNDKAAVSF